MSGIISFNQAKIAYALNQFEKDSIVTDFILETIYPNIQTQEDINQELAEYSKSSKKKFFKILQKIQQAVKQMTSQESMDIRFTLEDDYFNLLQNLKTNNVKYKVPSILIKYRKDINPIRALRFELEEIMAMPESDDDYHIWLIRQYKNEEKINNIIKDINADLRSIVKMQEKYKDTKKEYPYFVLPMSYYHCIEIETDMKSWIKTLKEFLIWTQDSINKRYL